MVTAYRRKEDTNIMCGTVWSGEMSIVWGTAWQIVCLWKAIVTDNFTLFWDLII